MDSFTNLLEGFATALTPTHLALAALGVLLGTAIGVLPGIGPAMAVALLLPVTYGLEPTGAFIMFAGIYYGGMYGGSTTSILLNTPGESASIVTALEGNKMARAGRGALLAVASVVLVAMMVVIRASALPRSGPGGDEGFARARRAGSLPDTQCRDCALPVWYLNLVLQ